MRDAVLEKLRSCDDGNDRQAEKKQWKYSLPVGVTHTRKSHELTHNCNGNDDEFSSKAKSEVASADKHVFEEEFRALLSL